LVDNSNVLRDEQPLKQPAPNSSIGALSAILNSSNLVAFSNESVSTLFIVLGRLTFLIPLSLNARERISVNPFGKLTSCKLDEPLNALLPIILTEFGIVTLVSF